MGSAADAAPAAPLLHPAAPHRFVEHEAGAKIEGDVEHEDGVEDALEDEPAALRNSSPPSYRIPSATPPYSPPHNNKTD
jgi:hypothetical protein